MSLVDPLARLALTIASRDRLSVLIYHRVPAEPDDLLSGEPHASEFEQAMRWIKSTFNVIPLADGVEGIRTGKLPSRALSITFDDGYANNATVAAPILQRLGLHATFFIATGCSTTP
jgi:peptidoglycan/xylan/chitin deacetylase (PgdA/CDA1 family)